MGGLAALTLAALAPFAARGQQPATCEVALRDGRVLAAASVGAGRSGNWLVTPPAGAPIEVPAASVLALHGGPVVNSRLPAAHLVGGEVVRGLLVGGDSNGENLELQSAVLGRLRLPVDRLECLVFQGIAAADLELPDGVDEALFQKATLGFDRIGGTVHQFGEQGIRFLRDGASEPQWYATRDLVGLRLRKGEARRQPAAVEVLTRVGDRLGAAWQGFEDGKLALELEDGRKLALPLTDLGCLTMLDAAVFLSTLTPDLVEESSPGGDALIPWRRDHCASGGALVASGRTHGRGLGVHSRSGLVFTVPATAASFWTRVAFDDDALRLPVRGTADVRVLLDDAVVFEVKAMHAGDAPRSTGLLPVRPGQRLRLEVDYGAGGDLGDRVDWLSAVFLPGPPAAR